MSTRHRLPLAPASPPKPQRTSLPTAGAPALASGRAVLAVVGEHALVQAFVSAVLGKAQGACAVFDADHFVGDPNEPAAVRTWLDDLPRDAWVLAVGAEASARLLPTFLVGLGRRHEMSAATTDLWLGQSSELVAGALVEALQSRAESSSQGNK